MEENICTGEIKLPFVFISNNLLSSMWNELHVCLPCCQELTKVKFFLVLSFPVFLLLLLLIFPLHCFLPEQHLSHLLAQTGSCTAWEELVAHHPSSVISASVRFRGREGGLWSRGVGASTVGKQAEGQKLEPANQLPKTKWWYVLSTHFFFSFLFYSLLLQFLF